MFRFLLDSDSLINKGIQAYSSEHHFYRKDAKTQINYYVFSTKFSTTHFANGKLLVNAGETAFNT